MSPVRPRKSSRRVRGVVPRLGDGLRAVGVWAVRNPQTFLAAAVAVFVAWTLWGFAQRTAAFQVATVELPSQPALTLKAPLIGTNLWQVDLAAVAAELKRQQPSLKAVRVIRQLPDSIRIEAIPRVPVAQVRLDRWYPVDREGFILPAGQVGPEEGRIRIVGVDRAVKAGQDSSDERLRLGLRVIRLLQHSWPQLGRRLTEVNVADPQTIRFVLDDDMEVRCGSEADLDTHLRRLRSTLRTIAKQQLPVQYIDMRFQEPVVAPRS